MHCPCVQIVQFHMDMYESISFLHNIADELWKRDVEGY